MKPNIPSHHTKSGKFQNPAEWGFNFMYKLIRDKISGEKIVIPTNEEMPLKKPKFYVSKEEDNILENNLHVTWIGQSGVYCQDEKSNTCFITDPQFSQRASMCLKDFLLTRKTVQWVGPKRIRNIPCEIKDLPKVDFCLISHNHYDHLDYNTCKSLIDIFNPVFYVPLKLKEWFISSFGKECKVVELDWWEKSEFNKNIVIHCLPCQHFANRGIFDRGKTLWSSWGVEFKQTELKENEDVISDSTRYKFYFAGDTGYNKVCFKEIGEKFGPIDFSLIPIGAYEPFYFMKHFHVKPSEAIQIALDVKSKKNLGIHFGTFILTTEQILQPLIDLEKGLEELNLEKDFFVTHHHGETKSYTL